MIRHSGPPGSTVYQKENSADTSPGTICKVAKFKRACIWECCQGYTVNGSHLSAKKNPPPHF